MLKPNNVKKVLKFYKGKEYKIIIENKDEARDSNFWDNYSDAYRMLINIRKASYTVDEKSDYYNNIIAFVGERGIGKTSCMKSFVKIISEVDSYRDYFKRGLKNYSEVAIKDNFLDIGTIDPSMFDKSGNLLELLITKMFKEFKTKIEKPNDNCNSVSNSESNRRELIQQFSKIYDSLKYLNGNHDGKSECIDTLLLQAEASDFRNNLKKLIDDYLIFMNAKENSFLLLQLDDIDLNIEKAYEMVEQIRKYLILPNVVILMATKMSQLFDIVKQQSISDFKTLLGKDNISDPETINRTEKYLEKLIPMERRLFLPEVYEVSDKIELEIYTGNKNENDETSANNRRIHRKFYSKTVDDGVRELIYTRTGLYFTKFDYKRNYIIPTNLRELHNFVMTLYNMKEIKTPAYKKAESILNNCFDFSGDKKSIDIEEIKESYLPLILLLSLNEEELENNNYPQALKKCIDTLKDEEITLKKSEDILEYFKNCKSKSKFENENIEENINEYEQHQFEWFKRYFIETWCSSRLKKDNVSILKELYKKEINFKNKYIVNVIKSRIQDDIEKCSGNSKQIYEAIMNIENKSLNISIGDVLLIVNLYSKFNLDDETKYFCYAIKTIYSIILYEEYGKEEAFYDGNKIKEKSEYSNYDRLIGGNFYEPDLAPLLTKEGNKISRDYRSLTKNFEDIFLTKAEDKKENPYKYKENPEIIEIEETEEEIFAKQLLFLFVDNFGDKSKDRLYRNKDIYYEREKMTIKNNQMEINLLAPLFNINTLAVDLNKANFVKDTDSKLFSVFEELKKSIDEYNNSVALPNHYYVGSIELLEKILSYDFKNKVKAPIKTTKKSNYEEYFIAFIEELKKYQIMDSFFYFSFESSFFAKLANQVLYEVNTLDGTKLLDGSSFLNGKKISNKFKNQLYEFTKPDRLKDLKSEWDKFKEPLEKTKSTHYFKNWFSDNFLDKSNLSGFKEEIDVILENLETFKSEFKEKIEKINIDENDQKSPLIKIKIIKELNDIIQKELKQEN